MHSSTYRVLMVCTGNICRSTMAQQVLDETLQEAHLTSICVDSAGISDEERGRLLDPRAARALEENGYGVPDHRARQVCADDLTNSDLILAMTSQHHRALVRLADRSGIKLARGNVNTAPQHAINGDGHVCDIRFFRSFDLRSKSDDLDVPDPWYGGYSDFLDTLRIIERVTPHIVEHIRHQIDS